MPLKWYTLGMNSKAYDVVLIPNSHIEKVAIDLSRALKEKGVYFALDGKKYFPHLSLYMLQIADEQMAEAFRAVSVVVGDLKPILVNSSHYHYENDYLDVEYHKTEDMIVAQMNVINALNMVRDGLREKDKARLATSTGKELANLLTYGYRAIGEAFHPHLTFTRFTAPQEYILLDLPQKTIFDGIYDRLGIFEMGENGTCVREVKTWKL